MKLRTVFGIDCPCMLANSYCTASTVTGLGYTRISKINEAFTLLEFRNVMEDIQIRKEVL
jgi:hypothetical protein